MKDEPNKIETPVVYSKFKKRDALNYIIPNEDDAIDLISRHHFPQDYTVIKKWAEYVLLKANLPLPKSPCHSWFTKLENGEYIEVTENLSKYGQLVRLSSIKKEHEHPIEYTAIKLLEEIELIEKHLANDCAKGVLHHTLIATAIYMEAKMLLNYGDLAFAKVKQVYAKKHSNKKKKASTQDRVLKAYQELTKAGTPNNIQECVALHLRLNQSTVSRHLKKLGLSKSKRKNCAT